MSEPQTSAGTAPVVEGLFDEVGLIGGRCNHCGRCHFPLAGHCPWCGHAGPSEHRLATEGTLWAFTGVQAPPPGYEGPVPFGFGVVELPADGLRVISMLTEADPSRLALGDAVHFAVVPLTSETHTWAFGPR